MDKEQTINTISQVIGVLYEVESKGSNTLLVASAIVTLRNLLNQINGDGIDTVVTKEES